MKNKTLILALIIIILLVGNLVLGLGYLGAKQQLTQTQNQLAQESLNGKVLAFARLFVSRVLKAQGEVDFETRLKLENSVREIGDPQLFNQWNKFVAAPDEISAQQAVKDLLEMICNKMK